MLGILIIPTLTEASSLPIWEPPGSPSPSLPMLICQRSDMASLWTACFSGLLEGLFKPPCTWMIFHHPERPSGGEVMALNLSMFSGFSHRQNVDGERPSPLLALTLLTALD